MKSVVLFLIGGVLLIAALVVNTQLGQQERAMSDLNDTYGDLSRMLGNRSAYSSTSPKDRSLVYVLGGVGAMFILAGIVKLGDDKKKGSADETK